MENKVKEQWMWLTTLTIPSTVTLAEDNLRQQVRLTEMYQDICIFDMWRRFNGGRETIVDRLGFLGVSTTDLNKKTLFITEGVSDFITTKAFNMDLNVWGKTKLSMSELQLHVVKSLFRKVVVVADNDTTGINKSFQTKEKLEHVGVQCSIFIPYHKDVTQDYMKGRNVNIKDLI